MKFPRNQVQQPHRRSFLSLGRSPNRTRRQFIPNPGSLVVYTQEAMACCFQVLLPTSASGAWSAVQAAFEEIHRVELQLTVFRDDSELAKLNQQAAHDPVRVSSSLFGLLNLSQELSRKTGGAFDPTCAPLSRCWGFLDRQGRVPKAAEIEEQLSRVGCRFMRLDEPSRSVYFQRPIELNLGAIGKGFGLDRAAALLRHQANDFLIHAGSSTILAQGQGPDRTVSGWKVGLRHPLDHDRNFVEITLRRGALSTSGAAEQKFAVDGRDYGHIIDPRTGWPATTQLSATALAPFGALADALSTAFYLMRLSEIEQFCHDHPGIGAVIVPASGQGELEVHRFGIDSESWEALP